MQVRHILVFIIDGSLLYFIVSLRLYLLSDFFDSFQGVNFKWVIVILKVQAATSGSWHFSSTH